MRALRRRPTTLERWPKGVHPGMVLATREDPRGGDAFYQKRIPKGAPDYVRDRPDRVPVGPYRRRDLPDRDRGGRLVRADGDDHVPPVAGASDDVDHPDELRLDLDPQPGTDFADAVRVAARRARAARGARLRRLPEDLGRPRRPHLRPDRAALDVHRRAPRGDRVRPGARAAPPRRGHDEVVEGGARRAHLRRLQPERARPDDRLGLQHPPEARRSRVGAAHVGRARPRPARGLHGRDDAGAVRRRRRPPLRDRRQSHIRCSRCSTSTSSRATATCPTRPTTRRCRASPSACSRRATATGGATDPLRRRLRQLLRAARRGPRGRRHHRADVAVRRLVEVDDHRRVVAGPVPLRAWRSTHAASTRSAMSSLASTRSMRIPQSWWNIPAR